MAHPLEPDSVSPAPPNPDAGSSNALTGPAPRPRSMPPAPTHAQTVAALRHFMAIVDELQTLQKNPALGKSDIHSQIVDGVTNLVASRFIKPEMAVMQLAGVPDSPLGQRKWVQQLLQQTIAAQNGVLAHHAIGTPGTLDWKTESQHAPYSSDDHLSTMDGLAGNYRPAS